MSHLHRKLSQAIKAHCPYEVVEEYMFHPSRKWRLDFAFVNFKVAVEIHGGTFKRKGGRGAHSRGARQHNDFDKSNEAQRLGWIVLQFDSAHLCSTVKRKKVVEYITEILKEREICEAFREC